MESRKENNPPSLIAQLIRDYEGLCRKVIDLERLLDESLSLSEEREKQILELRLSLVEARILSGVLPICASCKKIRNEKGEWTEIEGYVREHSRVEFSHGFCPECAKKAYADLFHQEREGDPLPKP